MKRSTYQLEVRGSASEICWQSLTDAQAKFWKKQEEDALAEYIVCEPSDREDEFPDVPENARIEGYWDEMRDIYHGYGAQDDAECTLYRLNKKGDRVLVWSCEISDLIAEFIEKKPRGKGKTPKPLPKHILVNLTDEDATLYYTWKNVEGQPAPEDLGIRYSPDGAVISDIQLFGKDPDDRNGDGEVDGREVWISTPKKLGL
jgi:hypothetical protein